MAGHSTWKNIQHRKGSQDIKKGKIFTKIGKEITVAAKLSGDDVSTNSRLRLALEKARDSNMPKDNIERAISRGIGTLEGVTFSEKVYEGYGAGGIAFVVECLTDNVNRTVGEVRVAFTRSGGNMGSEGSVAWMFHKKGQILIAKEKIINFDTLYQAAIECDAEDVREEVDGVEIICGIESFQKLRDGIEKAGFKPDLAEITRIAETYTRPEDPVSILKLISLLEDNDDVQNVYHNAELE